MEWRRDLKKRFNIPVNKELKGSKLAMGRNHYDGGHDRLYGAKAGEAYAEALRGLDFLPGASIFSVTCERGYSLFGERRLEAVLYAMFQRIQRKCDVDRIAAMMYFDEGHGEYRRLFRKACKHLPTGSMQGAWSGGAATKNIPLTCMIEDANFKDSKQSHFVQMADLVAYATLAKIRAEQGRTTDKEREAGTPFLFDCIPKRVLNRMVDRNSLDGINRLR